MNRKTRLIIASSLLLLGSGLPWGSRRSRLHTRSGAAASRRLRQLLRSAESCAGRDHDGEHDTHVSLETHVQTSSSWERGLVTLQVALAR
jgi:hypothetical protein